MTTSGDQAKKAALKVLIATIPAALLGGGLVAWSWGSSTFAGGESFDSIGLTLVGRGVLVAMLVGIIGAHAARPLAGRDLLDSPSNEDNYVMVPVLVASVLASLGGGFLVMAVLDARYADLRARLAPAIEAHASELGGLHGRGRVEITVSGVAEDGTTPEGLPAADLAVKLSGRGIVAEKDGGRLVVSPVQVFLGEPASARDQEDAAWIVLVVRTRRGTGVQWTGGDSEILLEDVALVLYDVERRIAIDHETMSPELPRSAEYSKARSVYGFDREELARAVERLVARH